MNEKEQWLQVVGYEGKYELSDCGRVRSLPRTRTIKGRIYRVQGKMLASVVDPTTGYLVVRLGDGAAIKKFSVHILVLEAFRGPRPAGLWGLHNDGVRQRSHLGNLRWGTPAENSADMIAHGNSMRGEKHPKAVLTQEMVEWIKESRQSSLALAPVFGVAPSTIRAVRIGQNWANQ
jgi:hypothetical protein